MRVNFVLKILKTLVLKMKLAGQVSRSAYFIACVLVALPVGFNLFTLIAITCALFSYDFNSIHPFYLLGLIFFVLLVLRIRFSSQRIEAYKLTLKVASKILLYFIIYCTLTFSMFAIVRISTKKKKNTFFGTSQNYRVGIIYQ